jgi:ABC-type lipopolysaccharide export system ATPase subunit
MNVVKQVSVEVDQGEIVGTTRPNGAGKKHHLLYVVVGYRP